MKSRIRIKKAGEKILETIRRVSGRSTSRGRSEARSPTARIRSGRYRLIKGGRWCRGRWIGNRCYRRSSCFHQARCSRSFRISRVFWMSKDEIANQVIRAIKITSGFSKSSSNRKSTITDSQTLCNRASKAPALPSTPPSTTPQETTLHTHLAAWCRTISCCETLTTAPWAMTSTSEPTIRWMNQRRTNTTPSKSGSSDSSSQENSTKENMAIKNKIHNTSSTETPERTCIRLCRHLTWPRDRDKDKAIATAEVAATPAACFYLNHLIKLITWIRWDPTTIPCCRWVSSWAQAIPNRNNNIIDDKQLCLFYIYP